MGVTIKCKKTGRNIDLGYSGFMRLRKKVANGHALQNMLFNSAFLIMM